jgi:hypothetical protein
MYAITSLYQNLLSDLGLSGPIPLTSDLDLETARKSSIAGSFTKKFTDDAVCEQADAVCLDKFLSSNDSCRMYCYRPVHIFHDTVINEIKLSFDDIVYRGERLSQINLASISAGFGVGPGASVDCESYDFYTKLFNSPLSRTSEQLYREYRCAIVDTPLVYQAELLRKAHKGDSLVAGSRLSFVPKTRDVSRSICTEPTLNMLFQKGIGAYLEEQLRRKFSIDLSKQPILNRKLAQIGSKDGTFGTIDLSSASDSISIELVRMLVPPELFRWLTLARSPSTTLPDGREVKLDMISSMGNAFTFPLMTLIFASLVVSCYRVMGITPCYGSKRNGPQNFAVFGDDIIVLKETYDFIVSTLEILGFTVNESKSFNSGDFRESCGGDYFKGHQIRGIYLKELSHESHVYSAFNRIVRWSSKTGIMLPRTAAALWNTCHPSKRWLVPPSSGDAEGFKVSADLHAELAPRLRAAILSKGSRSSSKVKAFARRSSNVQRGFRGGNSLGREYYSLVAEAKTYFIPDDKLDGEVVLKGSLPGFIYNGPGLLVSLLGGFIRNGRVSVRSEQLNRTSVRRLYNSSWNWTAASDLNGRDLLWELTIEEYLRVPCTDLKSCVGPPSMVV